jgi:hypothetical protein
MRRRYRNPRKGSGSSVITGLLPWVAIGGLLYLMAQNAGKVKATPAVTAAGVGCCTQPGRGGGITDFGVTGQCWCVQ